MRNIEVNYQEVKPLAKPQNQHQQALWYLINWNKPFSLKDVINHSMFYKFQSRLSELEQEHGLLAYRKRNDFTNVFGRKSEYNTYECLNRERTIKIYNKLVE